MLWTVSECLVLLLVWIPSECRLQEHRTFQYNTQVDGRGTYNFAYDTSHQPRDAHSLRMEYRDANGIVRGRYGYTDPRGKLRIVEYEAGPDGFKARGDVGPDLFPHMEAPGLSPQEPDPAPTPLRMAGWDPDRNPINERDRTMSYSPYSVADEKPRSYVTYYNRNPVYSRRPSYPVVSQTVDPDVEVFQQELTSKKTKSEQLQSNQPLTIYNIDVDPDEIRVAGPPAGSQSAVTTSPVYRGRDIIATSPELRYYQRPSRTHDHRHSDYSHPGHTSDYYSYDQRIQRPVQVRYRPSSHSDYSHRGHTSDYHSHAQRIQKPAQVRYSPSSHSDYSHRGHTSDNHSHAQIQKPAQVRYSPSSHYHGRQYHEHNT